MLTGKAINQGLKALDAQLKQTGTITSRLTPEQRAGLLKMFGKWKNKSFKLLPSAYSYGYKSVGSIDNVQGKLNTALDAARKFVQDEKLADDTVECSITYGHSLRVTGCLPMADAALAVKYTKRYVKTQKDKQARKNKAKAARDAAKQTALLNKTIALRDVAKLLKEINQLKSAAKTTKKAAKSVKKTKKAKRPVVKTTFPFENNGRG